MLPPASRSYRARRGAWAIAAVLAAMGLSGWYVQRRPGPTGAVRRHSWEWRDAAQAGFDIQRLRRFTEVVGGHGCIVYLDAVLALLLQAAPPVGGSAGPPGGEAS